jgi:hypothetical protein
MAMPWLRLDRGRVVDSETILGSVVRLGDKEISGIGCARHLSRTVGRIGPHDKQTDAPKTNPASALRQLTLRSGGAGGRKLEE